MENMNDNGYDDDERLFVKLRGLPWNSTSKDVLEFLENVEVIGGEKGVHMAISPRDGRPNGEAFVELATPNDVDTAFGYNKKSLGHRYIEVFNAKQDEYEQVVRRLSSNMQDTFVKLRGLPFSCKPDDIDQFFSGLEIKNGKTGIYIVYDSNGRMSGEAFVQFKSIDDAENALKRNREKIGHRYIEIFRSSSNEARRATMFGQQQAPRGMNDRGFNGGNDRGMSRGGGPRSRGNFRDRPYPDMPYSGGNNNNNDGGWRGNRNNNNGGNNNFGNNFNNDNFGPSSGGNGPRNGSGGGNNMFNNDNFGDSFSRGTQNMQKMANNLLTDFERNWKSSSSSNSGPPGNFNSRDNNDGPRGGNFNSSNNGPGSFGGSNSSFGGNNNSGGSSSFFNRDIDGPPPRNFGSDRGNNFNSNSSMNNGGSAGSMNNSGPFLVHMRGMPYDCAEMEVHQFFAPLKLVDCQILFNNNGRHTGEADAFFATVADAQEAMKKHKEKMGSRYIELFANRGSQNERRGRF